MKEMPPTVKPITTTIISSTARIPRDLEVIESAFPERRGKD